ncbi:Leucine--tRNA ligase, partial [Dissostichus eleginoides]
LSQSALLLLIPCTSRDLSEESSEGPQQRARAWRTETKGWVKDGTRWRKMEREAGNKAERSCCCCRVAALCASDAAAVATSRPHVCTDGSHGPPRQACKS